MIKKTWTVWALFLLVPGVVGVGIQQVQKKAQQTRITLAAQQVADDPAVQEYLDMYEKWSELSADQKANNPWGFGEYGGGDIQNHLREGQADRLLADIEILDKGMDHYPEELTGVIYGPDWQQEIDNYRSERSTAEMILIGSIFLLASGGLILTGGLSKLLVLYIMKKRSESIIKKSENTKESDPAEADSEGASSLVNDKEIEEEAISQESQEKADDVQLQKGEGYFQSSRKFNQDSSSKSADPKATELPMRPVPSMFNGKKKGQKDSYFGWAIDLDETSQFDMLMTNEPLTKELTELTEEVSAIRQFASQQQDQMRKLQDGYDWIIIRRFCLRIIRSIDNIDDRVVRLKEEGDEAADYLEDIRDELVFALEASGIEQFRPDLNITFKGLEKYAEAVRERVFTEDENLVGCIAEVARPGYQYLVNDEDVKIVRCAQVKLYDSKQI